MKFLSNLGGRKFAISIFGILVVMLYVLVCIHHQALIAIAVPVCTVIGSIIASFCATNAANDYVAMRKENKYVAPTVIQ